MRFSPIVFSTSFCIAYALLFFYGLPLFRYFPVHHAWAFGASDSNPHVGPAMVWYGLVAGSLIIGVIASAIVPDRQAMSCLRGWMWAGPVVAIAVCCYLLRVFFK